MTARSYIHMAIPHPMISNKSAFLILNMRCTRASNTHTPVCKHAPAMHVPLMHMHHWCTYASDDDKLVHTRRDTPPWYSLSRKQTQYQTCDAHVPLFQYTRHIHASYKHMHVWTHTTHTTATVGEMHHHYHRDFGDVDFWQEERCLLRWGCFPAISIQPRHAAWRGTMRRCWRLRVPWWLYMHIYVYIWVCIVYTRVRT